MHLFSTTEKTRSHLKWFWHVERRAINVLIRKYKLIQVEGMKKSRGRPKLTLVEVFSKLNVN